MNSLILEHDELFHEMCYQFVEKYYSQEDEDIIPYWYIVWEWGNLFHNVLSVSDDFWSIEDIYIALKHNITSDLVFAWYEYSFNKNTSEEWEYFNLYDFSFWNYVYTEEERQKDELKIKEAHDLFMESLNK